MPVRVLSRDFIGIYHSNAAQHAEPGRLEKLSSGQQSPSIGDSIQDSVSRKGARNKPAKSLWNGGQDSLGRKGELW
jgi:hypothetical protein